MNRIPTSMGLATLLLLACSSAPLAIAQNPSLDSQTDKVSYGMGVEMARNLKRQGLEINPDMVLRGIRDGLSGGRLLLTEKELRKSQSDFLGEVRRRQSQNQRMAGEANKAAGEAFLAENRAKEGVVALPSGLQYRILTAGSGPRPSDQSTVDCRYRGTLIDGTEFDSSEPGQTVSMKVKAGPGMTPGLSEALKLMPVGSKWKIFVPSRLGYGLQGAGRDIGPNATLIYEVELLAIQ